MKTMMNRRGLLRGLFAAPAIVAFDRLMPVKAFAPAAELYTLSWYEKAGSGVWVRKTRLIETSKPVLCFSIGNGLTYGAQLEAGALA